MSQNPSKRPRTQNRSKQTSTSKPKSKSKSNPPLQIEVASSSNPQPSDELGAPSTLNPLKSRGGKQGKEGKKRILEGYYYNADELQGTPFWNCVETQQWDGFLTKSEIIYPELVYYFYEHVSVQVGPSSRKILIQLELENETLKYTAKDFRNDFGLEMVDDAFSEYIEKWWPKSPFPSFEAVTNFLNNGRMLLGDNVPNLKLFSGEGKFATHCIGKSIVPNYSQDRKLSKANAAFVYLFLTGQRMPLPSIIGNYMLYAMENTKAATLPYGMLITHIMRKWKSDRFCPKGELVVRNHMIGRASFKHQKLVYYNNKLWCEWEIEEASHEDKVRLYALKGKSLLLDPNAIADDDDEDDADYDVGDDEVEEEEDDVGVEGVPLVRRGRASAELTHEQFRIVRENQERIEAKLDKTTTELQEMRKEQKRQGSRLNGLLKYFLCCAKDRGESSEKTKYLEEFSDEEAEQQHHQTTTSTSHLDVNVSDYLVDDPPRGEGMEFFPGSGV